MEDKYFWTADKLVLVIHSDNQIFTNSEGLTPLTDTEIKTYLNPPPPLITMEQVRNSVQNLTDSTVRIPENGGFKNMVDAYAWANMYQDAQGIALSKWDKSCWDMVDALSGMPPTDLAIFMDALPKFDEVNNAKA